MDPSMDPSSEAGQQLPVAAHPPLTSPGSNKRQHSLQSTDMLAALHQPAQQQPPHSRHAEKTLHPSTHAHQAQPRPCSICGRRTVQALQTWKESKPRKPSCVVCKAPKPERNNEYDMVRCACGASMRRTVLHGHRNQNKGSLCWVTREDRLREGLRGVQNRQGGTAAAATAAAACASTSC